MKKEYIFFIYNDLKELSSISLQRSYWLNGDKQNISSFNELMCKLFDDDCFDEFIELVNNKENFKEEFVSRVVLLHYLLNSYDEKEKSDEEILLDTDWIKIVKLANEVINLWPFEDS